MIKHSSGIIINEDKAKNVKGNNDLKKSNILEDGLNNKDLTRNINRSIKNNSSEIINNEDTITQNTKLLTFLDSNDNIENNNNENNNKDENNVKNHNKENNNKYENNVKNKKNKKNNNKDENNVKKNNNKENHNKNENNIKNNNNEENNNKFENNGKNNKTNKNINNINLKDNMNKCTNNINKDKDNKIKSKKNIIIGKKTNYIKNKKCYNTTKNNINYEIQKILNKKLIVEYPFPDTSNLIKKSNNILEESKCIKIGHNNKKQINKESIKQLIKNKTANKTVIHSRIKKIFTNTSLITIKTPNNKNISKRSIYSNKCNNCEIKENIFLNSKITNNKITKIKTIKPIIRRRTIIKDYFKKKEPLLSLNNQSNNSSYYLSATLSKNKEFNEKKKLIYNMCKNNINSSNNLTSYRIKKSIKYISFVNLRKKRKPNMNELLKKVNQKK